MKITYDNDDIPAWLKPHMKMFCDCGAVMADDGPVGYDGVMKLTQRWCMNERCPYHMAEKVEALAKYFRIEGVGNKTALDMIKSYKFRNHLQALPIWFQTAPEVHLYEVGKLAYIYGVDSGWKEWLAGYTSFAEYFSVCSDIPHTVWQHKDYLFECERYFRVKRERLSQQVLRIMLTGSIHGYNSRSEFLQAINEEYGKYFRIEDNKKTVRDTYCLVKEPNTVDHEKTVIAINNNIPIMTSAKFVRLLQMMKEELVKEETGLC